MESIGLSGAQAFHSPSSQSSASTSRGLRLYAFPQTYLYDGRGANRWWLQETPEPVIKGTWSTWAEIHPDTAKSLGIRTDDVIRISCRRRGSGGFGLRMAGCCAGDCRGANRRGPHRIRPVRQGLRG